MSKKAPCGAFIVWSSIHLLLHRRAGVLHARIVHVLTLEQVEVHFTKAVGKDDAEELRILEPVIFLAEVLAAAKLVGPPVAKDIRHTRGDAGSIVLEEGFLD